MLKSTRQRKDRQKLKFKENQFFTFKIKIIVCFKLEIVIINLSKL